MNMELDSPLNRHGLLVSVFPYRQHIKTTPACQENRSRHQATPGTSPARFLVPQVGWRQFGAHSVPGPRSFQTHNTVPDTFSSHEVDGRLFDNLIRDSSRWVFMIRVGVSPQAEIPAKAGTPTDDHNSESLHKRLTRWLEVADTLARSGKFRKTPESSGTNRQKIGTNRQKIGKKSAKIQLK